MSRALLFFSYHDITLVQRLKLLKSLNAHVFWRRERDSNPRGLFALAVFKTAPIDHSGISPHWYSERARFGFDSRCLPAPRSSHRLAALLARTLVAHRSGVLISTRHKQLCRSLPHLLCSFGEGEIRTRDAGLTPHNRLATCRLQPTRPPLHRKNIINVCMGCSFTPVTIRAEKVSRGRLQAPTQFVRRVVEEREPRPAGWRR